MTGMQKGCCAEFADELNSLGVRVSKAANTASAAESGLSRPPERTENPLTIDGHFMYRYEYVKNPRPQDTRVANPGGGTAVGKVAERNQFDGDTYFLGSLAAEPMSGTTTNSSPEVWQAFVAKKFDANTELAVGRFIPTLGMGTIDGTAWNDGLRISFGKAAKVTFYATTVGEYNPPEDGP